MENKKSADKSGTKAFLIFSLVGIILLGVFIFLNSKNFFIKDETQPGSSEGITEEPLPYCGYRVVIDAGHGGNDPGKVGVNGTLEKNINLILAKKLEKELQDLGMSVIMTRDADITLGEGSKNKKMQDLKMRVGLIDENTPDLAISIHQNSFTDPSVCGPQVFYKKGNESAGNAARCIQEALNAGLSIERPRECKDNVSYYLLSNTKSTLVIAECAFLSNEEEEALLNDESYLDKITESLVMGICTYLDGVKHH